MLAAVTILPPDDLPEIISWETGGNGKNYTGTFCGVPLDALRIEKINRYHSRITVLATDSNGNLIQNPRTKRAVRAYIHFDRSDLVIQRRALCAE